MKYPAIVKPKQHKDVRVLVFREELGKNAIHLDGCVKGKVVDYHIRDNLKNVTAEYLANTYGEVLSPKHAEFIRLMCDVNEVIVNEYASSLDRYFAVYGNELLFFHNETSAANLGGKKITIPLPPECEERKPKEVIANGKKHTLNLVTGFYDFSVIELGYVSGSTLKKLQEADDYQVLSFVDECDGSKEDEWPKVGSSVEWGHTGKGEVKSLSDGFAWIKLENKDYTTVYVSSLRKPKTPEQELRDELSDLAFNQFNDDSYDLTHNSYYLAEQLISKYDINKKPQ